MKTSKTIPRNKLRNRKKPKTRNVSDHANTALIAPEGQRTWRLRGVGIPDRCVFTIRASFTVGGAGGAVGAVTNTLNLNDLSNTVAASWVYDAAEFFVDSMYETLRVLQVSRFTVMASNKASAPVTVGVLASGTPTTLSSSNLVGLLKECDRPHGKYFHLTAAAAGKPIVTSKMRPVNLVQLVGPNYLTDINYCNISSGTGGVSIPVTLVYLQIFAAPTQGGNFTAATDPLIVVTADLTCEAFNRLTS